MYLGEEQDILAFGRRHHIHYADGSRETDSGLGIEDVETAGEATNCTSV